MAKRRQSAKQRAASLRNLRKARKALGGRKHKKRTYKAKRRARRNSPVRTSKTQHSVKQYTRKGGGVKSYKRRGGAVRHHWSNPMLPGLPSMGQVWDVAIAGATFLAAIGVTTYVIRQVEGRVQIATSSDAANWLTKAVLAGAVIWASRKVTTDAGLRKVAAAGAIAPLLVDLTARIFPQALANVPIVAMGPAMLPMTAAPSAIKTATLQAMLAAQLEQNNEQGYETGSF